MRHHVVLIVMLAACAGTAGVSALQPAAGPAALVVDGDVTKPLSLTAAEFKSLPRTKVEVRGENDRKLGDHRIGKVRRVALPQRVRVQRGVPIQR